jgi:hypothetical protein
MCELGRAEQENRALKSREWDPSPGHWYVERTESGRRMTRIGPVLDVDHAQLRVAVERAHDAACAAVLALKQPHPDCHYTVVNHSEHSGPCAILPSARDVVTAVLDAVAEALAHGQPDADRALADELLKALLPAARRLHRDDQENERLDVERWGDDQRIESTTLTCGLLRRVLTIAQARELNSEGPG